MYKQVILLITLLALVGNINAVWNSTLLYANGFVGNFIDQKNANYNNLRFGYNNRYNRIPNVILQPTTQAAVEACIKYAKENNLKVSIRSGGHSASFFGVLDERVVIDVSQLKGITLNKSAMTITSETGNKWTEIYTFLNQTTDANGNWTPVGTPGGSCPSVGSGLALGGGANDLSTVYGYAVDNVLELKIVLANATTVTANCTHNDDLYWALRGGGHGSFGVVTQITYRAYNLRPKYYNAYITYNWTDFETVLKRVNDYSKIMPDIINLYFTAWRSGSAATPSVALACFSNGDPTEGEGHCGTQFRNISGVVPVSYGVSYTDYASTVKTGTDPKARKSQTKGSFLYDVSKSCIKKIKSQIEDSPITPYGTNTARLNLYWQGGQMLKKARNYNAFVHRTYPWNAVWLISFTAQEYEETYLTWIRKTYQKMNAYSTGEVYQNYQDDTLEDWEEAYYAENYAQLKQIKSDYDPTNFFNYDQSIRPLGVN